MDKKIIMLVLALSLSATVWAAPKSAADGNTGEIPTQDTVLFDDSHASVKTSNKNEARRMTDREIIVSRIGDSTMTADEKAYYYSVLEKMSDDDIQKVIKIAEADLSRAMASARKDEELVKDLSGFTEDNTDRAAIYNKFLVGEKQYAAAQQEQRQRQEDLAALNERASAIVQNGANATSNLFAAFGRNKATVAIATGATVAGVAAAAAGGGNNNTPNTSRGYDINMSLEEKKKYLRERKGKQPAEI